MEEAPFELRDCKRGEGGVHLVFRCNGCGADTPIFIRDDDPLEEKRPLTCGCGAQVNLFFGSPLVGKALLKSLKGMTSSTPDATHRCPSVLLN